MKKTNLLYLSPSAQGPLTSLFRQAQTEAESGNAAAAVEKLFSIILDESSLESENARPSSAVDPSEIADQEDPARVKEVAVYALGQIYVKFTDAHSLRDLLKKIRPFLETIPKARTARIVRNLIDILSQVPEAASLQEELCLETIRWCRQEKRTFLRHRVETRLALLYHQTGKLGSGFELISQLLSEVKRLEDKLLLVEIFYIESKFHFTTHNIAKAKASLTAARSNANSIHCPPLLQADIDVMAGALHCEEGDPQTAFSYFYESFEAYDNAESPSATKALKYMMLAKLMFNQANEAIALTKQNQYVKYVGRETNGLVAVAKSYRERNLKLFEQALKDYKKELCEDPIIERHTNQLYQTLLEQNIAKVIEPFSKVEVEHVAKLMDLPFATMEAKLEEMILDKKIDGILDQGVLILFDDLKVPTLFNDSLQIFDNLSNVVNLLQQRVQSVL